MRRLVPIVVDALKFPKAECPFWQSSKATKLFLLFFPGNPGLVEFYEKFLGAIFEDAQSHNAGLSVLAVPHLNQSKSAYRAGHVYSLQEQIEHKTLVYGKLLREHPDARFILMGHSVGAFMCHQVESLCNVCRDLTQKIACDAIRRSEDSRLHRVIELFPTVHEIRKTPNANKLYVRPSLIAVQSLIPG